MPEFVYQVKNLQGELSKGTIEAPSLDLAVDTLHKKDLIILSLEEAQKKLFEKDIASYLVRPNQKDLVIFTRQLSTLIDANVPIVESLNTLSQQTEKVSFRKMIGEVADSIQGGSSLSQALSSHKIFDTFYISLVKSGEISGRVQTTLLYLADYLERSAEITSKIRGALAYPVFIIFALVVVTIIMMTTVLPQLLTILKDAGIKDLPISTRMLILVTNFVNKYLYFILAILIGGLFYLKTWIKTAKGKFSFDLLKIKLPVFGEVAKNIYLARIAETLSTLIKAGVPILEGLRITSEIVNHALYKKVLLEAEENVRGGGMISEVFKKYKEIPTLVTSMIAIGEKTGKTDFMFQHMYKFFKDESDRAIENIAQLIEPILVLFLGLVVGILVASILLPIYNLVGVG